MTGSDKLEHPAESLATALDRASGLLGTMGDLYNPGSESFSGGNTFVVHALSTASILIAEARAALDDLHYSCDLTILERTEDREEAMNMSAVESDLDLENEQDNSHAWDLEPVQTVKTQARDLGAEAQAYPETLSSIDDGEEPFAQSYLELLRKLTAAEVFASEQQALSIPGTSPELLPLLRSLREDLQKIHSAA